MEKMSGSSYNNSVRHSMWVSELNTVTNNDEAPSVYDSQSQVSDIMDDQSTDWDVKSRMKRLFETQCFTDVIFYPKSSRKTSISAHKAVLAIGSPLFTKMLFNDHDEDRQGIMEVQISNMPFDAFTNIVRYLYTDEVFFESDSLVQEILEGAKQFGIRPLVDRCKQYFESMELTNENVCSKLQMSISNKIGVLKERCIELIQRNTLQVINSTEFQNVSPKTIRTVCRLQSLNIRSEFELLDAVMNWLYAQPPEDRKQLLKPLLECIRFLTFTVTEFGDALKKHPNLLPSEEGLSIMLCLYSPTKNPDFKSLPSWCNRNTTSRCFFIENPKDMHMRNEFSAADSNSQQLGKVLFPLRSHTQQGNVALLSSLLQMKCVSGRHSIKAIKLSFEKPLSDKSMIHSIFISAHCHGSGFRVHENIQIANSESVRVEFRKPIFALRGDLIDIEAEAKNIKSYRFLQFDDTYQVPMNPHFQCIITSRPKQGNLFFIREIEYGPQERVRRNSRNDLKSRQRS